MNSARIAVLLGPFLEGAGLSAAQFSQLSSYLELLLKWNAKMNLTAVRSPEEIVTRHFGESLFAAKSLQTPATRTVADVGSGAGFPGLPLAIFAPDLQVTLIESHNKKATFLKEVVRAAGIANAQVFLGRAEDCRQQFDLVTLRAVERFEASAAIAASLVTSGGRLALLIGALQVKTAAEILPELHWADPHPIPQSANRVLFVGKKP
ncbi:MAG: 16S rRNA (guanine(527)-N(7))-methyltransferase RsmG [Acidobacteriales bacterium]|nr:16S rRNA (guanine(527)-N(7))-methyltransferase RsmG [Terriglobales bacterium]